MNLWKRYILRELIQTCVLYVFSLFFLYIIIDYSTHMKQFSKIDFTYYQIIQYYLCHLSELCLTLLPFCLLLSILRVTQKMKSYKEHIALLTAGISLRKIALPFLWFASSITLLLLIIVQYVEPYTARQLHHLHLPSSHLYNQRTLTLPDHSLLIFQKDPVHQDILLDVTWVQDFDHLYRMNTLHLTSEAPIGFGVALFQRKALEIQQTDHYDTLVLDLMPIRGALPQHVLPPKSQSLSQLCVTLHCKACHWNTMNLRESETLSLLLYKCMLATSSLLIALGALSWSLPSVQISPLLLYPGGVCSLLVFYMVLQASLIIGEYQICHPLLALGVPFSIATLSTLCVFYARIQ